MSTQPPTAPATQGVRPPPYDWSHLRRPDGSYAATPEMMARLHSRERRRDPKPSPQPIDIPYDGDAPPDERPMVALSRPYRVEDEPGFDPAIDPWPSAADRPCPACEGTDSRCRTDQALSWSDCWHSLGSKFDAPVRCQLDPLRLLARGVTKASPRDTVRRLADTATARIEAGLAELRADVTSLSEGMIVAHKALERGGLL